MEMSEVRSPAGEPSDETKDSTEKQTPKTAQRTLKINVVGPDGKPVAGVKIRDGIWFKEMTGKTNSDHVSDAQGQTAIELPKSFDILRLFTSCNGYVPQFVHWEQLDENPPDTYTIKLTKGTLIGGVVKNEEGQPIVGAKVEVMMAHDPAAQQKRTCFTSWLAEGDDARTTDAEGRWTLDNVPEGKVKLSVKITHPEYIGDEDWGGLQKEQKITLEDFRQQKGTIVLRRKK
jgi:protocatechuate 3,4-dioxygenase beta subunit